jgi:hypothetical protein
MINHDEFIFKSKEKKKNKGHLLQYNKKIINIFLLSLVIFYFIKLNTQKKEI